MTIFEGGLLNPIGRLDRVLGEHNEVCTKIQGIGYFQPSSVPLKVE